MTDHDDPTERLQHALAGETDDTARFGTLARLLEDGARRALARSTPPEPLTPTKETDDA